MKLFEIWKSYAIILRKIRPKQIEGYIIFYYPRQDGINVVRIVSGHRDLEALFD